MAGFTLIFINTQIRNKQEMFQINFDINEAITVLKPLALFLLGMVIYSVFVFKFYRFLASRDIFGINLKKYNNVRHCFFGRLVTYLFNIIEYIFLLPVIIFFWFGVLTVLLTFLAKTQPSETILLVSMALIGSVRVTAYYNEDLSKDLAKMLPFALLGVFLIDISYFSFSESLSMLYKIPALYQTLFYYLLFVIVLELLLRIITMILSPLVSKKTKSELDDF